MFLFNYLFGIFAVVIRKIFILLLPFLLSLVKLDMNISCGFNERLSSAASIILSLWFASSGLAAVIGNAVVLWLFYKNESLRTISNWFLASLCVADFLAGLVVDPMYIAIRVFAQPRIGSILLKAIQLVWIHSTAATVFNLCCVSVDRFIAIRFPFRYQDIITKKRCYAVIIMVWLISLLLPFPVIFEDVENLWSFLTVLMVCIPIALITLCYLWIYKAARKQTTAIRQVTQTGGEPTLAVENYKALKTIGFVLGVFLASWMPYFAVSVVHHLVASDSCMDHKLYTVVWPWIEAIDLTSSAINSLAYCFRNSEFRQALRRNFPWLFSVELTPERSPNPCGNQGL